MEIDSEDEDDSDLEYDSVDPWEHIHAEFEEEVEGGGGRRRRRQRKLTMRLGTEPSWPDGIVL